MGLVPLRQGDHFVIASDCDPHAAPVARPPRKISTASHVWTGSEWSTVLTDGKTFPSADAADQYLQNQYARLTAPRRADSV